MSSQRRLILFATLLGMAAWTSDALSHYWAAGGSPTLWSHLIGPSLPQVLTRLGLVVALLVFCGLSYRTIIRSRRVESSIKESESVQRGLAENPCTLSWHCDTTGTITYASPSWCELLGYEDNEILGRRFTDLQSPEVAVRDYRRLQSSRGMTPLSFETEFRTKLAGCVHIEIRLSPSTDTEGALLGWDVTATDITERKQGENRLEEVETRQQVILANSMDAFIGTDAYGKITDWNRRAEEMFGWSEREAIGKSLTETVIPEDDHDRFRRGLARFHKSYSGSIRPRRLEAKARDRQGRMIPVEISVVPVQMRSGVVFHAFVRDISKRLRAERRLRLAQFTLDQCADAVFWVRQDARITYANTAASNLLGYSLEELLAMKIYAIDPQFDAKRWSKFWQILRARRVFRSIVDYHSRAGERFRIEMSVNYVVHEGSELCCAYARKVCRDKLADAETLPIMVGKIAPVPV